MSHFDPAEYDGDPYDDFTSRPRPGETAFAFEDRDAVTQAADMYARGNCGFSDCLVVAKHARHGCDLTATFERGMRKLPRVKLL